MIDSSEMLKDVTEIHIFESPDKQEGSAQPNERESLSKFLNISGVSNFGYDVQTKQELLDAIDAAVATVQSRQSRLGGVFFHFSMHGNEQGISLTNGDFITWREMANLLFAALMKLGKIKDFPIPVAMSPIGLSFSTCKGLYADQINTYIQDDISLYMHLVGPKEEVTWSESLDAFTDFYHQSLNRVEGISSAVQSMNSSIGKEVFELRMGKGLRIVP